MKKLNKLCAILFAVLGVTTLKAQTDVTSTYLTNPSFEYSAEGTKYSVDTKELANGEAIYGWTGATISNSNKNIQVTKTAPNTAFGTTNASDGDYYYFIRQGWEDKTSSITQSVNLPVGRYYLSVDYKQAESHDDGKFRDSKVGLAITKGGTSLATLSTGGSVNAPGGSYFTNIDWKKIGTWFDVEEAGDVTIALTFVLNGTSKRADLCLDNVKLYKWDLEDQTNYDNASRTNPLDVTAKFVTNPYFDANTNGWTSTTGAQNRTRAVNQAGAISGGFFENWNPNSIASGKIYQTLSGLIDGIYRVTISAYGTQGAPNLKVYAGGNSVGVTSETPLNYSVETTVAGNGSLEIGLEVQSGNGSKWIGIDNVKLEYLGYDLTAANEQLTQMISEAQNIVSANEAAPKAIENLTTAITAAQSVEQNKNAIQTASTNLATAIDVANATVVPYAKTITLFTICESILANSEEFVVDAKETFSTAIAYAKTSIESAATADAINNVISELEAARQTYVVKADPTNDTYFDYTFLMTNPAVANGDGWTGARTNVNQQYTGAPDNTYWDSWDGAGQNIYQELTGLPSGLYTLKAAGRASTSCTSAYIYLNDTKAEIDKAGNSGNVLGNGWNWYTTEKTAVAGTAKVGFGCNTASSQWAGADDFHLYYYGFDVETAQNGVSTLKTEAEALVGKPMNAGVATALNEAIAGADATKTTRLELQPMIDALSTAVNDANASIAEYEKIAGYIAKANTIDGSIAADVQTLYDNGTLDKAEPVFQALEVATYNYVTENFNYNVALSSDWNKEGPVGELSDQHWSGEKRPYMEQSSAAWGQDAWSIKYDQDLTLPAGEYVFKVAGRKEVGNGCTLSLTVTSGGNVLGTVNDFPEGDQGYGIDTSGAANFSEEGTYANNDNGRGWQWRYVKFTLANEATVNIAVNAEATTNHQWISFCDATVQMTEETYLEANMGGLDAPTAAAEALVDTKPMGTAENQALKDALALPVTTGAELLAKIDALNAAVANANTWIANYNTAKAPLVAALERFETDYNNAENGALNHMNKDRWAYAVEMAQAAAVAKDVTNSYEGFATATENLVAALDAATVSVGEYTALKTAIDAAGTLYDSANWGDAAFQKPIDAKEGINTSKAEAQAAYDAAEVDGDDVTAVIESLNTAINDVVLNAPEEGQRFYIKVATEGHGKNGNAWLMTLGNTGDNNRTGYGINANNAVQPHLNQAFIFTQVEGNLYNISIERPEGTVYLTYGSLNESAAGWKNQQIQATTDAEKKGDFKIVPTGKNGILKIFNTVDNNYLDCQDGGSIYTDTGISNEEFAFELATEHSVTLNVSSAGWATLILPFNAEIPEGVKAYTSVALNNESVELVQVSEGGIKANTPYLIKGTGEYNFSGYGLADKDSYEDENGLFVGTYVDYATTGGEYVLQKHDDKVGFYVVGESVKPTVKAYRCYLTAPASEIKAFFFFDDDATGINGVDAADIEIEAIYTINGAKVNSLQKGLNIVKMSNGKVKKVFVK